jgi:hypothetical protein
MAFDGFKPRQNLVGFTAVPNEWFDEVMKDIDNLAELKIVQAVFRQTYGYIQQNVEGNVFKITDRISYSRFKDLTGLSKPSICDGIKRAINDGYIIRTKEGSIKGNSAEYKIRTKGEEKQTIEEECDVGIDKFFPKESDKEEKDLITEINFDKEQQKKSKKYKKKTQYQKYREKDPEDYHSNDLCYYFRDEYQKDLVNYGKITNKERGQMKKLLNEYDPRIVVGAIDFLMKNYEDLIDGYPSISVLYGFRKTIFPSVVKGKSKKHDVRDTKFDEEEIQKKANEDVVGWD